MLSGAVAAAATATGVTLNKFVVATANQLKVWFVADTKETTDLTADKHINRCEAPEKLLSISTATHPGEAKGLCNNCT